MQEISYEKNLVINNRELKYKGIFRADELFRIINRALEEKGYEKREKRSEELVTEAGRKAQIELRPFKVKSNYVTLMIKIRLALDNVTESVEVLHGERKSFQNGEILVSFDAWSLTDYANRWGMKPWVYFFKSLINKFIHPLPLESGYTGELVSDTAYVYAQVKKLLNSYKGEISALPSEEEIKKKAQAEMEKESAEPEESGE